MSSFEKILSILAAGSMFLSGAIEEAAPHQDVNGTLFLVNRQWMITDAYEPAELTEAQVPGRVRMMRPDAAAALEEMFAAFHEETGKEMISVSGFRAYSRQQSLYKHKLETVRGRVDLAQQYTAPPGASEHQLGLAMDIGQKNKPTLLDSFGKTEAGIWAAENCWRFGFILRYGADWEDVTGYKYEPWHFRYVGKELAKEIHDSNEPFETWLTGYRVRVLKKMTEEETE